MIALLGSMDLWLHCLEAWIYDCIAKPDTIS